MKGLANFVLGALLVTASAYTPHVGEGGPYGADGSRVRPGHTIAVSRDLKHLIGKIVHVEGVGRRLVNDTMARRWKRAIDVCVTDRKTANAFGRQQIKIHEVR